MWSKATSPRPQRAVGGLKAAVAGHATAAAVANRSTILHGLHGGSNNNNNNNNSAEKSKQTMDESVLEGLIDDENTAKMNLPPRYRFRDLILGDFAFNDDGER